VLDRYTWERTAESYLRVLEEIVAAPEARRPDESLPIHPYFRDAEPENDITLDGLSELYFGASA
jgi:sucrose-phosphate synthase